MVKVKSRDRSTEDIIAKMLQKIKTAYEPAKGYSFWFLCLWKTYKG
jgi:hypothetical protein